MKTLTQTISAIVALSLLAAGVVPANNASDEEIQTVVEMQVKKADIEQKNAEIAAVLAQVQSSQPTAPVLPTTPTPATPPAPVTTPTPPTLPAVSRHLDNLTALSFGPRAGSGDMVLIIPSEQTSTENLIAINEDMNVMSRIFETSLEQDRIATARSNFFGPRYDPFGMLLGGSRSEIQSMYLQGYGALFLLKVDFPLSPPSNAQEDEKEPKKEEQGDPVWQQMRQEMYEPAKVDNRRRRTNQPEEKYDVEKVENLKTTLIQALKHAANIRSLKPDESVILTVTGSGEITGTKIITANVSGSNQEVIVQEKNADGRTTMRIVKGNAFDDIGSSSPTILVIRAKRSEIDAFAKGEVDFNQFRGRVQVLTYPLLSGAVGSLNSHSNNIGLY